MLLKTDTEVEQIVVEDRQAKGVLAKGQFYEADGVISNADLVHTYGELIEPEHRRRWSLQETQENSIFDECIFALPWRS